MSWFEDLFGFVESPEAVRRQIVVEGETLRSQANGEAWACGRLERPSLAELRSRVAAGGRGPLRVRNITGEAGALHADPANAGALIQAASQFNLLEMTGPSVTPEDGITRYAMDNTQGPACALAAAAGTLYRNDFADVDGQVGQTAERQIDCLRDMHALLSPDGERLWEMRNGYALVETDDQMERFNSRWRALDEAGLDNVRGALRIGVHTGVEVTLDGAGHRVHQAYCSALPLAYSRRQSSEWEAFARVVLEGCYEATLLAAIDLAAPVFLTQVGGGVFGNAAEWIRGAMERAFGVCADSGLDVSIVHYGRVDPAYEDLARG